MEQAGTVQADVADLFGTMFACLGSFHVVFGLVERHEFCLSGCLVNAWIQDVVFVFAFC